MFGQMKAIMRVNGLRIKLTGKENLFISMVIFMMVHGKMIWLMVTVYIFIVVTQNN